MSRSRATNPDECPDRCSGRDPGRQRLMAGAIATALAAAASNAVAEQTLRPPTDNELRASYCVGYLEQSTQGLDTTIASFGEKTAPDTRAHFVAAKKLQSENLIRLRAYVVPRLQYIELNAMRFALESGKSALDKRVEEYSACIAPCPAPRTLSDLETACWKNCDSSELADRMQQCLNLSWLPF